MALAAGKRGELALAHILEIDGSNRPLDRIPVPRPQARQPRPVRISSLLDQFLDIQTRRCFRVLPQHGNLPCDLAPAQAGKGLTGEQDSAAGRRLQP
ncbi:hypothetical protein D3C87_1771780 [compost metagenome]